MQPNILDAFIIIAAIGTVLGACHRGLGREMLHTVLLAVMITLGAFFMSDTPLPTSPHELGKLAMSAGFYLIVMYGFMWGVMKLTSPLILRFEHVGLRSRFWAGALAMVKLVVLVLGLNLWYAIKSPDAHPLRLQVLPGLVKDSMVVQISDRWTDDIYKWLAAEGMVAQYDKVLERPTTQQEMDMRDLDSALDAAGISGTLR